jgi:hypothetical protein
VLYTSQILGLKIIEFLIILSITAVILYFYTRDKDTRKIMLLHAFFFIIVGHISVFLHFFIFPDIEFLHWLYYSSIIAYILSLEVILLSFIITASFKSLLYTQLSLFGLIFILATFGIFSAIDLLFIISINIVTLIVFVTAFYLLYKTREQVILIFIFAMLITTLGPA